jgi:Holliday junction resolvase RusA-like endonuclease
VVDVDDNGLRFVVFGRPQGKGSKRVLPIRRTAGTSRVVLVDSNKNAAPWAHRVSTSAAHAVSERARGQEVKLARGGVVVELAFYFARPKGHYGSGRNAKQLRAGAPQDMTTMPDVDKLARCAIDALTGVVIVDDSQVVDLYASKRYGEPERLEVAVHEL